MSERETIISINDKPVTSALDFYTQTENLEINSTLRITTTDSTAPFLIQIVTGASAGIAAKIAAEDFTEFVYIAATNSNDSGISELIDRRVVAGTKLWARALCVGGNASPV